MSPRTSFNSSQLVRCLAGLQVGGMADAPQTVAERLSHWLDWTDAISLAGALNGGPAAVAQGASSRVAAAVDAFHRLRTDLARAITGDALFTAAAPAETDFAPYRRQYQTHQRAMDSRIGPLRATVREAVSAHSPALQRLAALDAVMDKALAVRERHLLSGVPALVETHFARLEPQPAEWGRTLQRALLAELDVRLQPIEGLLEALSHDTEHPAAPPATPS